MLTNQERTHNVQQLLRVIYGVVPIVAGIDKFFNLLTDWAKYINPTVQSVLPFSATTFMHAVGVIEVVAGLIVLSRFSAFGAYIVSAWLAAIAVSLILSGHYLDVAVRDLVMSAGAYSLAVLTYSRQTLTAAAYEESAA